MSDEDLHKLKTYIVHLVEEQGIDEAERLMKEMDPLDPQARSILRVFGQLVQGDNGEWYFDERRQNA